MIIKPTKQNENQPFVELWGSGKPLREFLYVDDMAEACLYLMQHYESSELVNIGSGIEISIKELAGLIREIVGFHGEIIFDSSKPDGTPRRVLDTSKIAATGWKPKTDIKEGLCREYKYYLGTVLQNEGQFCKN